MLGLGLIVDDCFLWMDGSMQFCSMMQLFHRRQVLVPVEIFCRGCFLGSKFQELNVRICWAMMDWRDYAGRELFSHG